jgi:4-diphosphocytidyl-2-C-methyl-D-erythritol kinase
MSFIEVKSFAKINLALNVTGKLKLLHKIESIVSFISLSDLIFIKKD